MIFNKRIIEIIGLVRSFLVSYCVPGKRSRLLKLYQTFMTKDSLCFDIGANFGNRIPVWTKLGAQVVAIEPQPKLIQFLTWKYSKFKNVTLLQGVVSDQKGRMKLFHNTRNPTLSSIDEEWIIDKEKDPIWGKYKWDAVIQVEAFTLDQLINQYGVPDFCKIDVEGAELQVLQGLSIPLKGVSFEYLTIDKERAFSCIDRLEELGSYEYNWTISERSQLKSPKWLSAEDMKKTIKNMNQKTFSGDVYGRLRTSH